MEITVPGTLSNLGPGYDALGLAVSLVNGFRFTFEAGFAAEGSSVDPEGQLTLATARRAAIAFGVSLPGLQVWQQEEVPRARGLGSSATARVAGLLAALSRREVEVPLDDQLSFLSEEEGHPDNVVPALVGGLCIVGRHRGALQHVRLAPPRDLTVALCVPDLEVSTPEARAILPTEVSHGDATFTAGRVAFLMAGLLEGRLDALALGVDDRLHQSYRAALIGPVDEAFAMAQAEGAAASFVSGSGSTLAAFVSDASVAERVAQAMGAPFRAQGRAARALVVRPVARGALVTG